MKKNVERVKTKYGPVVLDFDTLEITDDLNRGKIWKDADEDYGEQRNIYGGIVGEIMDQIGALDDCFSQRRHFGFAGIVRHAGKLYPFSIDADGSDFFTDLFGEADFEIFNTLPDTVCERCGEWKEKVVRRYYDDIESLICVECDALASK